MSSLNVPLLGIGVVVIALLAVGGYFLMQPSRPPIPPSNNQNQGLAQVLDGSAGVQPSITPSFTPAPPTFTPMPMPTLRPTATDVPVDTPLPSNTPLPTDTPAPTSPPPTSPPSQGGGNVASNSTAPKSNPPPPTATPKPGPGLPLRLRIPAIGVNAAVEYVGVASDGTMAIPADEWDVAWFKKGYRPGSLGNAVIDGHLDWTHGPAVFWNLAKLNVGDAVYVSDDKGTERKFLVTDVVTYPYNNAPLTAIFGPSNTADLNLITCNGVYSKTAHNYNKRLVVYTTLAP